MVQKTQTCFLMVMLLTQGFCYVLLVFTCSSQLVAGIQVLRFQEDRVATSDTYAWYDGPLDPSRKLLSVTLCGRFFLFTLHSWATFFMLIGSQGERYILEGDVWVERVRPVLARNWNFQVLKKMLWVYRWHHLCFTYDRQLHMISTYLDGHLNNQQEIDIVRHIAGQRAKLGQGGEPQRSLSGDLTQVNVWDRALTGEEIRQMAECENDPQGNYVSWEVGWTLHNITSYDEPLDSFCMKKVSADYFWFPEMPIDTAYYLCQALGSQLPSVLDMEKAKAFQEVARVVFPNQTLCNNDYWTDTSDTKEEGVWRNGDSPVNGDIPWLPQEPNGLQYENCAVINGNGIADIDCDTNDNCIVCAFNDHQRFSLLGTCELELRNAYFTASQPNVSEILFIGYGAYQIRQEEEDWTWVNVDQNLTIARMEKHVPDYPMGRRWWVLEAPVCGQKPGGRRLLLLSPCQPNEFTCDDGTCIPLKNRCDLKYDCRDNTDEYECHIVAFPKDYQKHLAPRDEEASLPLVLNINIDSLSVKTMHMIMEVSYQLILTWVDNRLLYRNLKVNSTLNTLPTETMKKLWTPQVSFINTRDNQRTQMDEDTVMMINRLENAIRRDNSAPAEVEIFSGDNTITSRRKYWTVFMCDFDLGRYPFDSQECYMHLRITSASRSFIQFDPVSSSVKNLANKFLLEYEVSKLLLEHGAGGDDDEEGETYLFSEVKVRVLLARRYGYAILNIYMPTLVLMVVSYVTLFFRPAIFDTRMMSALTVQLVIATLFSQVSASLPKTSYFKMVDVWLIFCIGITFLTIIFHVVVDYYANKSPECNPAVVSLLGGKRKVAAVNSWVSGQSGQKKSGHKEEKHHHPPTISCEHVVKMTKVVVICVFVIFNIFYWGYVLA